MRGFPQAGKGRMARLRLASKTVGAQAANTRESAAAAAAAAHAALMADEDATIAAMDAFDTATIAAGGRPSWAGGAKVEVSLTTTA